MKFKTLAVCILPVYLLLSGCVPVALVAGATAGGAVIYDNRSMTQMNTDHDITQQATERLNNNEAIKSKCHIAVATYNGIVLLVGQAPTPELRTIAYNAIKNVPNIVRVYNEISVAGPTSVMQRTSDSWITTKVKSAMLAQKGLHSTEIKVVTEDGVVYLMGKITRKQASIASDVSRRISGVQRVVTVFEFPH